MDESSIQTVRARAKELYASGNDGERQMLDLLLAAVDDVERDAAGSDVEGHVMHRLNIRSARFNAVLNSLESMDKLGSFEIHDLMSQYDPSQSLAASVGRKPYDSGDSVIVSR